MILKGRTKMLNKILIFVFIMHFALIMTDSKKFSLNEVDVKCREKNHLEQEEVARFNHTKHLETNDERIKCFIKCFLTELKLMNDDGELTLNDNPGQKIQYKKHYAVCKDVTGTDLCDKALNFHNCLWDQIEKEKSSQ